MVLAAEFWMPGTTVSPTRTAKIGDYPIQRRVGVELLQHICNASQIGAGLSDTLLLRGQLSGCLLALRAGLDQPGL